MVRRIVRYGADVLTVPAQAVTEFDDTLDALVADMIETMHAAPGVGLAAPQIGVNLRVCVIDLSVGRQASELVVLVNPEFVSREGMQVEEEGCLSVPGFAASVPRPARAIVRGVDQRARPVDVDGRGLLARALQHEIDHLDGLLFLNRLRWIRRRHIVKHVERLRRQGRW